LAEGCPPHHPPHQSATALCTPYFIGFRSTFKEWCSEVTAYPNVMSEMALSHALTDKVEAAYRRGDMREKRRKMMEAWATYCAKPKTNVVPLKRKA